MASKMPLIGEPSGKVLTWEQPNAGTRYHTLKSDEGALVAMLKWPEMYGSLAVGEWSAGRLTFDRAGFLHPYVTARVEGTEIDKAILKLGLHLSGSVGFQDGVRFSFNRLSLLESKWNFTDEKGSPILSISKMGGGKPTGDATLLGEMPWESYPLVLALIAWYAIILDYEEREAAVGEFPMGKMGRW